MILLTNAAFLTAAIVTGAIKHWRNYYPTVVYLSLCNLLYNFLAKKHLTWQFHPDWLLSHKVSDLLNTFVLLPSAAMLYLHFFPMTKGKKIAYYLAWVAGFSALEYLWFLFKRITYQHGWSFIWSIGFYFVMFLALRLHYTHLGKALFLSLAVIVFLIIRFDVPIRE
ncbi:CBO0543 family protein [Paenibacillus thermotolerans]|uniref:CBO0543 family protein n=1 Tax=Paenibacillus thermotolerans TaxID=3027807 RepID=UPI0023688AAC|nr:MULTISPECIES: CBO0543 family protein [unclassified Paenibacillus]